MLLTHDLLQMYEVMFTELLSVCTWFSGGIDPVQDERWENVPFLTVKHIDVDAVTKGNVQ